MPFPISIVGSVEVEVPGAPEDWLEPLVQALEIWMIKNRAVRLREIERGFSFKGGVMVTTLGPSLLARFSYGEIDIVPEVSAVRVRYRLRLTELLITVVCLIGLWFAVIALTSQGVPAADAIYIPLLIAFSVVSLGYFIASKQVPRALDKLVRDRIRASF